MAPQRQNFPGQSSRSIRISQKKMDGFMVSDTPNDGRKSVPVQKFWMVSEPKNHRFCGLIPHISLSSSVRGPQQQMVS